jgi:hypothetical protein
MQRRTGGTALLSLALALAACGPAPAEAPRADQPGQGKAAPRRPEFEIDYDANRVVCRDTSGKVRWSARLEGYLGRNRPPHLLHDAERAYVSNAGGVTALDARTGKAVWHSEGPSDHLLLSGGLLLAVDCRVEELVAARGRWLLARAAATGAEVFRTRLPVKDYDPDPIEEVAGLFVVQPFGSFRAKGDTLLIDRTGKVRHRLDDPLVDARRQGDDLLLLTATEVARVAADGRRRWSVAFPRRQAAAGGQLLELPGGDVLAYLFGCLSDSGVQVVRLGEAGKAVWRVRCAGLGVLHSEYQHEAKVAVEGGRLKVTSVGSSGSWVEVLDLKSGRQVERTRRLK